MNAHFQKFSTRLWEGLIHKTSGSMHCHPLYVGKHKVKQPYGRTVLALHVLVAFCGCVNAFCRLTPCSGRDWSSRPPSKDSSGGHDQLSPHHLAHSGPLLNNWICKKIQSSSLKISLPPLRKVSYFQCIKEKARTHSFRVATEVSPSHPFLQRPLNSLYSTDYYPSSLIPTYPS